MGDLIRSSDGKAEITAWENRRGRVYVLKNQDDEKQRRNPTDYAIERANRVVLLYNGKYYTASGVSPEYTLDDVIADIESDVYKETIS